MQELETQLELTENQNKKKGNNKSESPPRLPSLPSFPPPPTTQKTQDSGGERKEGGRAREERGRKVGNTKYAMLGKYSPSPAGRLWWSLSRQSSHTRDNR